MSLNMYSPLDKQIAIFNIPKAYITSWDITAVSMCHFNNQEIYENQTHFL